MSREPVSLTSEQFREFVDDAIEKLSAGADKNLHSSLQKKFKTMGIPDFYDQATYVIKAAEQKMAAAAVAAETEAERDKPMAAVEADLIVGENAAPVPVGETVENETTVLEPEPEPEVAVPEYPGLPQTVEELDATDILGDIDVDDIRAMQGEAAGFLSAGKSIEQAADTLVKRWEDVTQEQMLAIAQHAASFDPLPLVPGVMKIGEHSNWVTYASKTDKNLRVSGTTRQAKSNNPNTWVNFETASRNILAGLGYKHLGFVTNGAQSGWLTGIDLDGCRNPEDGSITAWAQEVLDLLGATYVEVTPSGNGLRPWVIVDSLELHDTYQLNPVIGFGKPGKTYDDKNPPTVQIEIYNDGQYLTVTGDKLAGTPSEVRRLSAEEANALVGLFESIRERNPLPQVEKDIEGRQKRMKAVQQPDGSIKFEPIPPDEGFKKLFEAVGWQPLKDRLDKMADRRFHNFNIGPEMSFCPMPGHGTRGVDVIYRTPTFHTFDSDGVKDAMAHCFCCKYSGDMVRTVREFAAGEEGGSVVYKTMYDCARAICQENDLKFEDFFPQEAIRIHVSSSIENAVTASSGGSGVTVERPKLLTEVGNARRLIETYGKDIRFCSDDGQWLYFGGKVWQTDRHGIYVDDLMKRVLITMQAEAEKMINQVDGGLVAKLNKAMAPKKMEVEVDEDDGKGGTKKKRKKIDIVLTDDEKTAVQGYITATAYKEWAVSSESNRAINGAVEQAKSEPGMTIAKSALDSDIVVCNVLNGSFVFSPEKKSITFRQHLREDYCTKMMGVEYIPNTDCPQFKKFLEWMFPDADVRKYLQKYFGLCLTGILVRKILILWGEGANGKGTLMKVLRTMFGEVLGPNKERLAQPYAASVGVATFSVGRDEQAGGARADLVPLKGARLIIASETNKPSKKKAVTLDMARLKEFTGGDETVARGVYAPEETHFTAQAKIIIQTNNAPDVQDDSEGAWERLKKVNCNSKVSEKDQDEFLHLKLLSEAPGILNWLLEGIQAYFNDSGFGAEPESITRDTEEFRGSENHMSRFVSDEAELSGNSTKTPSSDVYIRYKNWCLNNGEEAETQKALIQYIQRRFKVVGAHTKTGNMLSGLRLKPAEGAIRFGSNNVSLELQEQP